jgi:hypothetical protein
LGDLKNRREHKIQKGGTLRILSIQEFSRPFCVIIFICYRMHGDYLHINPNFPCIYGANAVGLTTFNSVFDGHKYACGLTEIKGSPIVYSFGSDKRQDFEEGILKIRPDARIYGMVFYSLLLHIMQWFRFIILVTHF